MSEHGVVVDEATVRFERLLPGPVERVWAWLTEPEKRAQWFAGGELEPREGGALELVFRHGDLTPHEETPPEEYRKYDGVSFTCRITRFEPPHVFAFTWDEEDGGESEVTFELKEQGDKVLLVLTHSRLPDRKTMLDVSGGWHSHLAILVDKLNGRVPAPFWETVARLNVEYAERLAE